LRNPENIKRRLAYAEIMYPSDARDQQFGLVTNVFAGREGVGGFRVQFPDGERANFPSVSSSSVDPKKKQPSRVRLYLLNVHRDPLNVPSYIECFGEELKAMRVSKEKPFTPSTPELTVHVVEPIIDETQFKSIAYVCFGSAEHDLQEYLGPDATYSANYKSKSVMSKEKMQTAMKSGALYMAGLCVDKEYRTQKIAQKLYTVAMNHVLSNRKSVVVFLSLFNVLDVTPDVLPFDTAAVRRSHTRLSRYYRGWDFYPIVSFESTVDNKSYTLMVSTVR